MNNTEYAERSPKELAKTVPAIIDSGLLQRVIIPVLFSSADKYVLLVGDTRQRKMKLPDQKIDLERHRDELNLVNRISELGNFCFMDNQKITEFTFLGLARHKKIEKSLILPVVVELADEHQSPWLEPSTEWETHVTNNTDHLWVKQSEISNYTRGNDADMLTANTAYILATFGG